jgi:formylglycine-generating enzyme required for sulfatase activity
MRAAPESFRRQISDLSEFPDIRHDFVLKAVKWQQGTEAEKIEVEGQYFAYKDFKRLRGVLKQISFSKDFTPGALDSMIYVTAPSPKNHEVKPEGIPSKEAFGVPTLEVKAAESRTVEEEVALQSGTEFVRRAVSARRSDGTRLTIGGMDFMRVPAGKFVMGNTDDNEFQIGNEKPQHTIDLAYDYWMGKFILTNRQFADFIKDTKYETTADKEGGHYPKESKFVKGVNWAHPTDPKEKWEDKADHPVVQVSWDDAMAYCKWFNETFKSELGDLLLRLPTEAEWEKAARGAYGNEWPWGNEFDLKKCNSFEGKKGGTTSVGAYSSLGGDSPYGCADMVGNVWEWTYSLYAKYPYDANDGREDEASRNRRVMRGGSFNYYRYNARCAYRGNDLPDNRNYYSGVRLCVLPHHISAI